MSKKYNIFVSKSMIEDNYKDGEIGNRNFIFGHDLYGTGKTLQEAWNLTSKALFGSVIDIKQCSNIYDTTILIWSRLETENETIPTENEIKAWEKDKQKLYSADYEFKIVIEEDITKEELEKTFNITLD